MKNRILVQHSEESIRTIVCSMLKSAGYECRESTSPAETWNTLNTGNRFDLLLCQVMESLESRLIERVVKNLPNMPVVVMGGRPEDVFAEARRRGAHNYLQLPFRRDKLLRIVHSAIGTPV